MPCFEGADTAPAFGLIPGSFLTQIAIQKPRARPLRQTQSEFHRGCYGCKSNGADRGKNPELRRINKSLRQTPIIALPHGDLFRIELFKQRHKNAPDSAGVLT
jgi:hypothetical protein